MPFLFLSDGAARPVEIAACHPDATLADLCLALGIEPRSARLCVDGSPRAAHTPLAECGLNSGSTLDARTTPGPAGPGAAAWAGITDTRLEVRVTGGLDAGGRATLDAPVHLGRAATAPAAVGQRSLQVHDPTVSIDHATVHPDATGPDGRPTICDHGSTNGTWRAGHPVGTAATAHTQTPLEVGDVLRLGATEVSIWPITEDATDGRVDASAGPGHATRSFDRPPRATRRAHDVRIVPPRPPEEPTGPSPLGLAGVGFGLVAAGVAVVALHSWLWGLFALIGPLMLIASTFDQRRHGRRRSRRAAQRFRRALALFEADLATAIDAERALRAWNLPDLAELVRRAETGSRLLWERRLDHPDALRLRLGTADTTWDPPIHGTEPTVGGTGGTAGPVLDRSRLAADQALQDAIETARTITEVAFPLDLSGGATVGIAGPRDAVEAVTRGLLVQLCVLHGPADVRLHLATTSERLRAWEWAAWFPHARDHRGVPRLAATRAAALLDELAAASAPGALGGPAQVLVVDDLALVRGQRSVARRLLGPAHPDVSTIVLAERADQLPAGCGVVVALGQHGEGQVVGGHGGRCADLRAAGLSAATAGLTARTLAGWSDPEHDDVDDRLPDQLRLFDLLGLGHIATGDVSALAAALAARWATHEGDGALRVPIGEGPDGTVEVDLDRDGPHALVAGTTGAGKSELLRSFVAGLAARAGPGEVAFVLVDFKGGSAFDRCALLPHTVGVVSDLDAALAARAIRGIRRELRHREVLLRDAGALDLRELRRRTRGPGDPAVPPRLVIVVDEFATLATELPHVLDALVSVAQRGRSLGLHLVLATQRPAGVVSDRIRANTALRIALRLPDAHDSSDVIDAPDAARLPRHRPGRALARFGPDEIEPLQVALVQTAPPPLDDAPVTLASFGAPEHATEHSFERVATADDPRGCSVATDLDRLVAAARLAAANDLPATAGSARSPLCLWSPPLPRQVSPAELRRRPAPAGAGTEVLAVLLVDRHDETGHDVDGWHPAAGPLLVEGPLASGTTTALRALVRAAATGSGAEWVVHVLDGTDRGLAGCEQHPAVANVVGSGETERRARLLRIVRDELGSRQASRPGGDRHGRPPLLLIVDDLAACTTDVDDPLDPFLDALGRLVREGTPQGIHVALAVDRFAAVPPDWRAALGAHWLLGSAASERAPRDEGGGPPGGSASEPATPGRAVVLPGRRLAQVVHEPLVEPTACSQEALSNAGASPPPDLPPALRAVGTLPRVVALEDLGPVPLGDPAEAQRWPIPVGIGDRALVPVCLPLGPGGLALVAGPPRSGRTNALAVLGAVAGGAVEVVRIAGRASGAAGWFRPDEGVEDLRRALAAGRAVLALVDDLDVLPDDGEGLAALVRERPPGLRLVASTTTSALRSAYGHVVRELRTERCGILLAADLDLDGELLGTRLPRRAPAPGAPGRGWLVVDGLAELAQLPHVEGPGTP